MNITFTPIGHFRTPFTEIKDMPGTLEMQRGISTTGALMTESGANSSQAAGGPSGGGGGNGGVPYSYEYVCRLIMNNLSFPAAARKTGLSGTMVVAFTLKGDG